MNTGETEITLESLHADLQRLTADAQELASDFDSLAAEYRKSQDSRRGPEGPAGRAGRDGAPSTVPGPAGVAGRDGRDAKIAIGKVEHGVEAAATLRTLVDGTQVLDLVLPRGERGSDGKDSIVPGPAGRDGESITGPQGASIVGPQGKDGKSIVGPKGDTGIAATIEIGEAFLGDVFKIENVGTKTNAILNITLPRPKDGRDGIDGRDGEKGEAVEVDEEKLIHHLTALLEVKLRRIWKSDAEAIANRALKEHSNQI